MKEELREALGKAAYEAEAEHVPYLLAWDDLMENGRETYRLHAEGVVNKLAEMLIPALVNTVLSSEQIEAIMRGMR